VDKIEIPADTGEVVMRKSVARIVGCLFFLLSLNCLFAQQAVVRRSTILRPQPDTTGAPEAKLQPGDKLTLLDPTPEHGYYQVKTQDGKDGWVFSKSIKIVASPSSSEPAIDPEATAQGSLR
jgi:hypothetical protein